MLIENFHRNLSVLVLIFALSCAPLFAARDRGERRSSSKEDKTENKQVSESDSERESGSKVALNKPKRERNESQIRERERSRRGETDRKAERKGKRDEHNKRDESKKVVARPQKPSRSDDRPARSTDESSQRMHRRDSSRWESIVTQNRSPMQAALINIDKKRDSFRRQIATRISPEIVYHERPSLLRHRHRYEHIYRDRCDRLCHRIIWPGFSFVISYRSGCGLTFGLCYPYYHRKYIFVSLGGCWPTHYSYRRYYWYGCHPDYWYGCYPVAQQIEGDTYNYYTYNYYGTDGIEQTASADDIERLARQPDKEPAAETLADKYFEQAVKAFEEEDYQTAAKKFAEAIELEGDDIVLPFAYAQALFADKRYADAAEALRLALAGVSTETQGLFYPRGLYTDDKILFEQIDALDERADAYSFDGDLQLLLGYHLLGVGLTDEAAESLQLARRNPKNSTAAEILLRLLDKIKTDTEG
jgi:tetratricopeptide (TPR) repeat protein